MENSILTDNHKEFFKMMQRAVEYIEINQEFRVLAMSKNIDIDLKENETIIANILDDIKNQSMTDYEIHMEQLRLNTVDISDKYYGL